MTQPSRPWTELSPAEKRAAVKERILAGKSWRQIADELSIVNRNAIASVVNRLRKTGDIPPARSKQAIGADGGAVGKLKSAARRAKAPPRINSQNLVNKAESRLADPGIPLTISRAAAFDPLPDTTPAAFGSPGCKWPVDGLEGRGLLWCGCDRQGHATYCPAHRRLAFTSIHERAA